MKNLLSKPALMAWLVLSTIGLAAPASAETKLLTNYWGISYHFLNLDTPGVAAINPKMVVVDIGHHLSPSWSLETRMGVPSTEETIEWNGQTANQRVNLLFTAQMRKGVVNYKGAELYGVFGLTYSNVSTGALQSGTLTQATKEALDLSYGLGVRFRLATLSRMTGHIEYDRLTSLTQQGLSSLNIGVNYYF
ncbi:MAG: porin family protein [Hydrogenovibrio sp.]|nr:porin family protein [Hydrogenovibrio sp.]